MTVTRWTKKRVSLWAVIVGVCVMAPACIGPPLSVQPDQLPSAIQDQPYSEDLSADNQAVRWRVKDGDLPSGLTLDASTGLLAGRPSVPGTYDFTVEADTRGLPSRTGTHFYTITVVPQLRLAFNPPPARVGEAYDYTPTIAGGVPPYTVQVVGLPGGLDFDRFSGRIFGSPLFASAGLRVDISIVDSGTAQQTVRASDVLVIRPTGVVITTSPNLPAAAIGVPYSTQLAATSGRSPYHWLPEAGVLPDGLRLNNSTGVISGTPTSQALTETFTISVSDFDVPPSTDSRQFKLVVPVVIATTTLPAAPAGAVYDQTVTAAAGVPPYSWTVMGGQLPAGLQFDPNTAKISGTPAAGAETGTITVKVTDSDTPPTSATEELKVVVPVTIAATTLPDAPAGAPYSQTLQAANGLPPYVWSIATGALPAGLALDPNTGMISGTPNQAALTSSFTIRVTDSDTPASVATQALKIVVPVTISTTSLPDATVGVPYLHAVVAAHGRLPYTWTLVQGQLPNGLALNAVFGVISGIPLAGAQSETFTVEVTDADNPATTAQQQLTIQITP